LFDQQPERFCLKIGVCYVKEGQKSEQEIFFNAGGSLDYQEFLSGLGWGVNPATHPGFVGGLDLGTMTGEVAPYYSNYSTEVIFHVSTLMMNSPNDSEQAHKKRLINKDHVLIVWIEDDVENYSYESIFKPFNEIHIVIHPLANGMYQVRVVSKDKETSNVGPLLDNMMLRKDVLASLVRTTAINGTQKVESIKGDPVKPYAARKKLIEDIAAKFKREESVEQFFTSIFTAPPDLGVSAPQRREKDKLSRWSTYTTPTNNPPRPTTSKLGLGLGTRNART